MKLISPSYQNGFATRGESDAPGLWTGCVGLWAPSLGPTGLTLRDQSGYGNHGTLTNMDPATDWVVREKGYTLELVEASSQYINLAQEISFANGELWNFSAWVVPNSVSTITSPLGDTLGVDHRARIRWYTSGALRIYNTAAVYATTSGMTFTNDSATHISVNYTGAGFTVYRNGLPIDTDPLAGPFIWSKIGSNGDETYSWGGLMGEVSFHNRSLLSSEIQQLYQDPDAMLRPRSRVYPAAAAAPAGLSIPIAMYHYQHHLGV